MAKYGSLLRAALIEQEGALLTKNEIARAIEEETGVKPNLVKRVLDSLADLAAAEVSAGNNFSVPGIVKITYRYTSPLKKGEKYKKGETYVGFGGVEQTAEADSPARSASIRIAATPASPVKKHMPARKDKSGQAAFLRSKAGKRASGQ